ncbi:MAG: PadR family transcriptional regulator [Chloroflexota bacterium]
MAELSARSLELLSNWELVYKKGLLTFWILLLLHERASYPYEMNSEIASLSNGTLSADGNSIYRALRRFESLKIVQSEMRASETGPARRYYTLTTEGEALLAQFIERNICVFYDPAIKSRVEAVSAG